MGKTAIGVLGMAVLLGLAVGIAAAQQPPTQKLKIELVTRTRAMPKMPGLPPGMHIPGMGGAPTRVIDGTATYAIQAVAPVYVSVPADLGLANDRLTLNVTQPTGGPGGVEGGNGEGGTPGGSLEMVTKLYWHPAVAQGPLTDTVKIQQGAMRGRGGMQMPNLDQRVLAAMDKLATGTATIRPPTAKGQGDYICNTGGMATLDGFLPPLNVTAPALETVTASAGFTLQWDPVAGARGYLIVVTAMKNEGNANDAKMNLTSWYSTLVEPPLRVRGSYEPATTIADDLANGILLPGDTTSCVVPSGVFSDDYTMLTVRMEAIGNDFYSPANPVVYGIIRSEWTGMKMNMGAMGGGE